MTIYVLALGPTSCVAVDRVAILAGWFWSPVWKIVPSPPLCLSLMLRHGTLATGRGGKLHPLIIGIRPVLPDASIPEDIVLVGVIPLGVQWHWLPVITVPHQVLEHFKHKEGEASPGNAANEEKLPLPGEIIETEAKLELQPGVVEKLPERGFLNMALGCEPVLQLRGESGYEP